MARTPGTFLLAGAAAVAMATASIQSAPTANATCASFFGIGNSANCQSNLTSIAIAIGTNAQALAPGYFGAAFSVGTDAVTLAPGLFGIAAAVGDNTGAVANGVFGISGAFGNYAQSSAGGQGLNIALNLTPGTTVSGGSKVGAIGFGNIAVNLFGSGTTFEANQALATGIANTAIDLGGNDTIVWAGGGTGVLNGALNVGGNDNFVAAGPGPVSIAVSILQNSQGVTKSGPGFNINGFTVGGAAATGRDTPHRSATPSAASDNGDGPRSTGSSARGRRG
ncbi:hypothetical protein [Mycobacterium sp. M26]|uniref:hypothetical protein n=1 Tax=Mycobacterium sp. M26 TaxID=1762962 RepID=UPI000A415640|nr:hypothetical protein [Mycobacterium sp. M26]